MTEKELIEFLQDFVEGDVDDKDLYADPIKIAMELIQIYFDEMIELRQAIYTMKYG